MDDLPNTQAGSLWLSMCTSLNLMMISEQPSKSKQRERLNPVPPEDLLFGRSAAMRAIRGLAEKISRTKVPILLCGDAGTGKEALARWIHQNSNYSAGEFVKVNCAAICGTLLESELFGYERGAFTGADQSKPGRVELAEGGTLFLDEIAELDLNLQSKLLHFLQDGAFSRLADHAERRVDTRVICATNKDLDQEVHEGRFRQDLFYRIYGFRIKMPSLRERREDIPALAEFFRNHYETEFGIQTQPFLPQMLEYLQNMNWNGNVRELSNGIARYVLIGPEAAMAQEVGQKWVSKGKYKSNNGEIVPLKRVARDAIRELEGNVILETLRANQWNRRKTALVLKISYRALIYKIRDAGLVSSRPAKFPVTHHRTGRLLDAVEKKLS
jgi:two-component system, NtrC family, response regulator AtoC